MCAPKPPDYSGAAQAQGAANLEAAKQTGIMSNPNIIGPSGGQTVTFDPNNSQPTITQNLSPAEQQIFNANQQARLGLGGIANQGVGNVAGVMGQPFDFANYLQTGSVGGSSPQIQQIQQPSGPFNFSSGSTGLVKPPSNQSGAYSQPQPLTGAVYPPQASVGQGTPYSGPTYTGAQQPLSGFSTQGGNFGPAANPTQAQSSPTGVPQQKIDTSNVAQMPVNPGTTGQQAIMQRLQPQIDMERSQLDTQLRNQGLTPGSEAYNNAMRIQNQRENDLLSQATLQGLNLDFQANQQGFGQAQAQGQFGNTALQQALSQALQQRELPLNEVSALMSGSQVSTPAFQGYQGSQVQAAPVMQGITNQGNYNAGIYNSQMQGIGGLLGLGTGIGMAGLFSDRRLKTNIRKIGEYRDGIGMYEYDIFGEHQIGAMADEVEEIMPEAIWTHPSGFKVVNYAYLRT